MSEIYIPLRERLSGNPMDLKAMVSAIHASGEVYDEDFIDSILGIPTFSDGLEIRGEPLGRGEQLTYEGTSYEVIREVLDVLKPTSEDVIYDLGSGYGRFCLYGALTTDAQFRGIEMVRHRVRAADEIKDNYRVDNASFERGNVLDYDLSDATAIFMFNPFSYNTKNRILTEIDRLGERQPLRVVMHHMEGMLLDHKIFRKVNVDWKGENIRLFETRQFAV